MVNFRENSPQDHQFEYQPSPPSKAGHQDMSFKIDNPESNVDLEMDLHKKETKLAEDFHLKQKDPDEVVKLSTHVSRATKSILKKEESNPEKPETKAPKPKKGISFGDSNFDDGTTSEISDKTTVKRRKKEPRPVDIETMPERLEVRAADRKVNKEQNLDDVSDQRLLKGAKKFISERSKFSGWNNKELKQADDGSLVHTAQPYTFEDLTDGIKNLSPKDSVLFEQSIQHRDSELEKRGYQLKEVAPGKSEWQKEVVIVRIGEKVKRKQVNVELQGGGEAEQRWIKEAQFNELTQPQPPVSDTSKKVEAKSSDVLGSTTRFEALAQFKRLDGGGIMQTMKYMTTKDLKESHPKSGMDTTDWQLYIIKRDSELTSQGYHLETISKAKDGTPIQEWQKPVNIRVISTEGETAQVVVYDEKMNQIRTQKMQTSVLKALSENEEEKSQIEAKKQEIEGLLKKHSKNYPRQVAADQQGSEETIKEYIERLKENIGSPPARDDKEKDLSYAIRLMRMDKGQAETKEQYAERLLGNLRNPEGKQQTTGETIDNWIGWLEICNFKEEDELEQQLAEIKSPKLKQEYYGVKGNEIEKDIENARTKIYQLMKSNNDLSKQLGKLQGGSWFFRLRNKSEIKRITDEIAKNVDNIFSNRDLLKNTHKGAHIPTIIIPGSKYYDYKKHRGSLPL